MFPRVIRIATEDVPAKAIQSTNRQAFLTADQNGAVVAQRSSQHLRVSIAQRCVDKLTWRQLDFHAAATWQPVED